VELGPLGGDKINILKAGGNYGRPTYGYGRDNNGSPMPLPDEGIEQAWITWNPGITRRACSSTRATSFPSGKFADIVAVAGDPLPDITEMSRRDTWMTFIERYPT
jgi:glucose/arabinose dehydrogenase